MKHASDLHPQFLMAGKQPAYAVLPIQEYNDLLQTLEAFEDNRAFEEAMQAVHSGEESYPSAVVYDLLVEGKNPFTVWRTYRELSKTELAKKAKISVPYLSQLESGKRTPSLTTLRAIAKVLNVDMEVLVPSTEATD